MELCSKGLLQRLGLGKFDVHLHTGKPEHVYPIIRIVEYAGIGEAVVKGYVLEVALSNKGFNKFTFEIHTSLDEEPEDFNDSMVNAGYTDGLYFIADIPNKFKEDERFSYLVHEALRSLVNSDFGKDWGFAICFR